MEPIKPDDSYLEGLKKRSMEPIKSENSYLDELKSRSKQTRAYTRYQDTGVQIAYLLGDLKHKSLYIKLAKEGDADMLFRLAKSIAENKLIKNPGAYFMRLVTKKDDSKSHENRNDRKRR
ncbi:MAG: hypothetical protein AAB407_02655 [Patescibacteria group bacterium]